MKNKRELKKLAFHMERLRELTVGDLKIAGGAAPEPTKTACSCSCNCGGGGSGPT